MATGNTDNMRVINEEYERMLTNSDNVIMSDDLMGRIMGTTQESQLSHGDSHEMYISYADETMVISSVVGTLHTLRQNSPKEMSVSFEVANVTQDLLTMLTAAVTTNRVVNIKLNGQGGFSCEETNISSWDFMKVAPHQHLISLTFGGTNVTF